MESSDAFFTLICICDTEFCPVDSKTCPTCNKSEGKGMKFNTDAFLNKVYELDKNADALDLIFDAYFNFWNRFDIMAEIYQKLDVSKITDSVIVGFLVQTFKYSKRLPEHAIFFAKSADEIMRRGKSLEDTEKLLKGLEGEGNFWQHMKELGATGIMWGARPEDK